MNQLVTIAILGLLSFPAHCQDDLEPTVVLLYPNALTASDPILNALEEYSTTLEITEEVRRNFVRDDLTKNWKLIRTHELDFIQHQDFLKLFVITVSRDVTYKEANYHDRPYIFPLDKKLPADRLAYHTLADSCKVSWVVNFTNVTLTETNGVKTLSVYVQMYNAMTRRLFIDSTFKVTDQKVPEGCEAGSWDCLIENIKGILTESIVDKVEKNRHYHRKM
jgi:hypothetical protein